MMWVATAGMAKVYICPLTRVGGPDLASRVCKVGVCYSERRGGVTLTKT
jgi:hypothetical protein